MKGLWGHSSAAGLLGAGLLVLMALAVGCGGGQAPAGTTPSGPDRAAVQQPAGGEAAPKEAGKAAWLVEWERLLAAAKREGRVVVTLFSNPDREAVQQFSKYFPEIKTEAQILQGRDFVVRVPVEQQVGIYNYDVYMSGSTTGGAQLAPLGVLGDTRAALFRPDVVADENWVGEFDDWWADDTTKKYQRTHSASVGGQREFTVNRRVAPKGTLERLEDWLKPEFRGKFCGDDPRTTGGDVFFGEILLFRGEALARQILPQIRIQRDSRQRAADLVRGDCVAASGGIPVEFERQGLTGHLETVPLNLGGVLPTEFAGRVKVVCCGAGKRKSAIDGSLSHGVGGPALVKNPPHPNAARLFLNWFYTTEGQREWLEVTGSTTTCSIRRDLVERCEAKNRPIDGKTYYSFNAATNFPLRAEFQEFARRVLGR